MSSKSPSVSPASLQCVNVVPSKGRVSSRDVGWTSLLVDLHTGVSSSEDYASVPTPDQVLGVAISGRYTSEVLREGRWRRGIYGPGAICVHRPNEVSRYRFPAPEDPAFTTALVYLPHQLLAGAADQLSRAGAAARWPLHNMVFDRDPAITQMTKSLLVAMAQGLDNLYAETAAAWLAVHLVTRHFGIAEKQNAEVIRDARLARVVDLMSVRFAEPLTLEELAAEACISKYHFSRLFRKQVGQTPYGFLTSIRLEAARRMLVTSDLSIAEVGAACGYPVAARFSAAFTATYGLAPKAFRTRHERA